MHGCVRAKVVPFDAELQAIVRALVAPPLSCSIHIYSDSQAALKAISSFDREPRERARFRMACFPILSLISSVVRRKRDSGAKVVLTWVAAHSTSQEIEHVGNRIADFTAKRFCNPNSLNPHGIQPLTLASCYPFVALYNESRLLIGDPRRCCRVVLHSSLKGVWERSRTQSRFSGMQHAASALWHAAISFSPAHTPLALRILTDTIQWMRDEKAPYAAACTHCRHVRDLEHLVQCHDLRRERAGANTAVCRILIALDLPSLTAKPLASFLKGNTCSTR